MPITRHRSRGISEHEETTFCAVVPPQTVIEEMEDYIDPAVTLIGGCRGCGPSSGTSRPCSSTICPTGASIPASRGLASSRRVRRLRGPRRRRRLLPRPLRSAGVLSGRDRGPAHPGGTLRPPGPREHRRAAPDGVRFVPHLTMARTRTRFTARAARWARSFGASSGPFRNSP